MGLVINITRSITNGLTDVDVSGFQNSLGLFLLMMNGFSAGRLLFHIKTNSQTQVLRRQVLNHISRIDVGILIPGTLFFPNACATVH